MQSISHAVTRLPDEVGKLIQYLIGTGDDTWEIALLLILSFDYGFDYTGMVGSEIHETVSYTGLLLISNPLYLSSS